MYWRLLAALAAAAFLIPAPVPAGPAPAGEPTVRVDLVAGPLQEALDRLADQARLQILYDPDLLQGLTTRGLHGMMTPAGALEKLLAPTGLTFEFTAVDAVALHAKARGTSRVDVPARSTPPLGTITINADRIQERRFDSSVNLSTVGIDESSLVVPVSVSSLTQQLLRDQQATRLEDVVELVGGTEVVPDGQSAAGFEIRGFPTYQYYLDGVRVSPDLHHDGFRDLANIDHIDIVKGPASLLYGRTEPGGLINVITKQPLATPMLSLEQQAGSFGHEATLIDAGGPLSAERGVLYRLNAAWDSSGSFRNTPGSRRIFVSPVLTWQTSPRTETTAYLEYLDSHDPSDSGLPIIGSRLPPVPIGLSLDEGGQVHTTDIRVGVRGSYAFEDGWTLRHHVDARWVQAPQAAQITLASDGLVPVQCNASSCPVSRELTAIPVSRGYTYYASVDATREFSIWRTRHSLLAGIDYFQTGAYSVSDLSSDFSLTTDLFHPHDVPIPAALLGNPDLKTARNVRERWEAAYLQDQVSLGGALYLLVGVRFDAAFVSVSDDSQILLGGGPPSFDEEGQQVHAIKQREGVVWHPSPWWSLYAKYTENFGATPGLYVPTSGASAIVVPAQSANEWEVGVKLETADGRAAGTLAVFDLTKQNISSPPLEPALDPQGLLYLTGRARNLGLEIDFQGEILPGLQVLANYTYIDSRITHDTGINASSTNGGELVGSTGDRLFGVARNGGSAWGSYRFSGGGLNGLKFGAGVIVRGGREGDNFNDYGLPGFTRWNTFVSYNWHVRGMAMSAEANIDNLFNARYFESLSGTHTVMPASPRRWMGSLRVEF